MTAPRNAPKADELRKRVASYEFWYHRIELPGGVITPGWAPIDPSKYGVPADLHNKRVLDVGAWDGYWTFEALKRGARQVNFGQVACLKLQAIYSTWRGELRKWITS
jgi:tRNA (mo5U34)-methyltransferase